MTGLLDTHTFVWWADNSPKLFPTAGTFIRDPANTVLLSVASIWEVVIKHKLGKLPLSQPLGAILSRLPAAGITVLPVQIDHALAVDRLPDPHRDPFDQMLVAQAIVEGAVLLTVDPIFQQYPVTVVW
ncbi:MAG TPA: type II toxin-antitoxin system VapC family toxin [Fimbriiglobus sp.]|nr:type II toxin-antitoxin system VapC family toxin [Fimbriiglobus sp.]